MRLATHGILALGAAALFWAAAGCDDDGDTGGTGGTTASGTGGTTSGTGGSTSGTGGTTSGSGGGGGSSTSSGTGGGGGSSSSGTAGGGGAGGACLALCTDCNLNDDQCCGACANADCGSYCGVATPDQNNCPGSAPSQYDPCPEAGLRCTGSGWDMTCQCKPNVLSPVWVPTGCP